MSDAKTAKELITESIATLAEQLQQGKSEAMQAYLSVMGRFHNYSFGNQLAIARQKPDAERVAGFQAWKQLGRNVKKGERAIRILAPMVGKKKDESAPNQSVAVIYGFRSVCVFDISQTEGEELPEFASATGTASHLIPELIAFAASQQIQVEFVDDLPSGTLGLSCGGTIKILSGQTDAETFATLAHEVAHELMHKGETRKNTTKLQRELEAESVAFVVGCACGLNMGTSSADYIQLYDGNRDALTESLTAISHTSTMILDAMLAKANAA